MELVRGVPITEHCDQNSLSLRDRLELFAGVCQAVQHAHTKGIIHRDLKPSNVLVTLHDGNPVVKVIDFGVAKAVGQQLTDKTIYTRFVQMVGTPLYMSPEQAGMSSLDIDTRSDIYALGVLLYELLTGTTPFDRQRLQTAAFDEMRRIIREEEPPKPSTRLSTPGPTLSQVSANRKMEPRKLSALVKGDLDWIVMKALEKDRARRYETASALATDVRRFLSEEPVAARPPTALYRLGKLARRNKVALTTSALVCAALVVGTIVSTFQAVRATRARHAEQIALGDAKQSAEDARKSEAQARRSSRKAQESAREAQKTLKISDTRRAELLTREGTGAASHGDFARAMACFAEAVAVRERSPAMQGKLDTANRMRLAMYSLRLATPRLRVKLQRENGTFLAISRDGRWLAQLPSAQVADAQAQPVALTNLETE